MAEATIRQDEVAALIDRIPKKALTLLFAAKDTARNNAVVLRDFIDAEIIG